MELLDNAVLQAAGVVLLVQEILKLKIIPLAFANRYPVPTNVLLSVLASVFILDLNWAWENAGAIAVNIVTVGVTAAIAFNQLFGNSKELREMEG